MNVTIHTNNYTEDIEQVLQDLRHNSVLLYKEHTKRYLYLKDLLKWYKIPIIVGSSLSSIISVSQEFIPQQEITILNSILSLFCSIIVSIELFMGVSTQMALELSVSKDYHILAIDIQKCLTLKPENRTSEGRAFLEQCYGTYVKLMEQSGAVRKKIEDKLCEIVPKDSSPSMTPSGETTPRGFFSV